MLWWLALGGIAPEQSGDPAKRARAIVQAVTHYQNPKILAEVSEDLGDAMVGLTMCVSGSLALFKRARRKLR